MVACGFCWRLTCDICVYEHMENCNAPRPPRPPRPQRHRWSQSLSPWCYPHQTIWLQQGRLAPIEDIWRDRSSADISSQLCYGCRVQTSLNCELCEIACCGAHSRPFAHHREDGRVLSRICTPCDFADAVELEAGTLSEVCGMEFEGVACGLWRNRKRASSTG